MHEYMLHSECRASMHRGWLMFERRKFATQSQYAYEMVRKWIITRKLLPGERIIIDDVAGELGMSNIPVRDALRELAAEHLVTRANRRGWAVMSFSEEDIEGACIIREALAVEAARRCALKATAEDIEVLREIADRVDALMGEGRRDAAEEPEWEFHLEVARLAGGPKLSEQLQSWMTVQLMSMSFTIEGVHMHREIVDAIARGDPDPAQQVMRRHVQSSETVIRENRKGTNGNRTPDTGDVGVRAEEDQLKRRNAYG